MLERITGPFHGYFIAAYACPMGELGDHYLGEYRISHTRPKSFCDAQSVRRGHCEEISATAALALSTAELCAMQQIGKLPQAPKLRHWGLAFPSVTGFMDSLPFAFGRSPVR